MPAWLWLWLCVLMLLGVPHLASAAPATRTEHISDDNDVTVTVYPAQGDYLLLWIAPNFGFLPINDSVSSRLAAQGIEVWHADLLDALFLPHAMTAIHEVDGRYVADLIERAHAATGKKIVLASSSYGAIPALRGARAWQARQPKDAYLAGAVLFSPLLYNTIPALGQTPEYVEVTEATSIPVAIFQGATHGARWQLDDLVARLGRGGAGVYTYMQPGVAGLFYDKLHTESEQQALAALPEGVARVLPLLARTKPPLQPAPSAAASSLKETGFDTELRPYRGKLTPPPIDMRGADGKPYKIADYRGKVTVVNFWATWCPSCVQEIPALNRLRAAMADAPFALVTVNYAESPAQIRNFMQRVGVQFPVLIDPDGAESARWGVVVFPSTFVIGPDGVVRYGVNAAIEWDSPSTLRQLRALAAGGRSTP